MKTNACSIEKEAKNESDKIRKQRRDARLKIDASITSTLKEMAGEAECRAAFQQLLAGVRVHTDLLKPTPGQGSVGWAAPVFLIGRLSNLARHHRAWLRPCEAWRSPGGNLRAVFRSLAAHLLTGYPVPAFMDSAWDLPVGAEGFLQQAWYVRLGQGARLRDLDLPVELTRKMEHYVRQAPDHYTVLQALRFGETRGLGGTKALAGEIALGRLGRKIEQAEFWRSVLSFFVQHPDVPLDYVNPIIDFIDDTKFGGEEILTEQGPRRRLPPHPEFTMKGRTLHPLLRLTQAWHADLAKSGGKSVAWPTCGLAGHHFLEKRPGEEDDFDWTIQELTDSGALRDEGRAMRHCVSTYANRCWRRETTIWSLRLRVNGHEKRMATIEVDPRKRAIVQARAKCNLRVGGRSREIMRQWSAWAGLQLDPRL
jgi:hypothetical protein